MRFRRYSRDGIRGGWSVGQEATKEGCRFVETLSQMSRNDPRSNSCLCEQIEEPESTIYKSDELVPWLTRGSPGPDFEPYDPLLSTPGSDPSELPPSPGYSRLPMNGHHSVEASQSSISGVLATERVNGEMQGEGRERGRTRGRQATGDSTRSLPPPYSSGTSGVGMDLSQR